MEAAAETTKHLSVGEGATTAGPIFSTHYNATYSQKLAALRFAATQLDHVLVRNRLAEFGAVALWLIVR